MRRAIAALCAALLCAVGNGQFNYQYTDIWLSTGQNYSVLQAGLPAGSGAPVAILLHGFPEGSWSWSPLLATGLLNGNYTLIVPDLRGYNASSKAGPYTAAAVAEDVLALVAALSPAAPVHLIAHDFGGAVAWWLAALDPALPGSPSQHALASLTIINMAHPVGLVSALRTDAAQQARSTYILQLVNPDAPLLLMADNFALLRNVYANESWFAGDASMQAAYLSSWSQPGSVAGAVSWYPANIQPAAPLWCITPACWQQGLNSTFDVMPNSGVTPSHLPVRVLWGSGDDAFDSPYQLAAIQRLVAGPLNITQYPQYGHFLAQEAPLEVAQAVAAFLHSL